MRPLNALVMLVRSVLFLFLFPVLFSLVVYPFVFQTSAQCTFLTYGAFSEHFDWSNRFRHARSAAQPLTLPALTPAALQIAQTDTPTDNGDNGHRDTADELPVSSGDRHYYEEAERVQHVHAWMKEQVRLYSLLSVCLFTCVCCHDDVVGSICLLLSLCLLVVICLHNCLSVTGKGYQCHDRRCSAAGGPRGRTNRIQKAIGAGTDIICVRFVCLFF